MPVNAYSVCDHIFTTQPSSANAIELSIATELDTAAFDAALMGAGPTGRANRTASSQLPRRASNSHLLLKPREQGQTKRQPEHHDKLVICYYTSFSSQRKPYCQQADGHVMQVLLFFILVIGTFIVIIQHRLFLPVSPTLFRFRPKHTW